MKTVFYLPATEILEQIQNTSPTQQPALYNTGVKVWVGQTYHRLKQIGLPVELSSSMPKNGLVITHSDHVHHARRALRPWYSVILVATRADRSPSKLADFEIVQNSFSAQTSRQRHIPHWPQPGIRPRNHGRGTRVENIVFKGAAPELNPQLASTAWAENIRNLGMIWHADAATWVSNHQREYQGIDWTDYTQADVLVALRNDPKYLYPTKPASKLINAWHAGVPALLGPEVAYRELRRSALDYIEVASPQEVLDALRELKASPSLYQDMIANSQLRAQEFTANAINTKWQQTIDDLQKTSPSAFGRWIKYLLAQRSPPRST